MATTQGGRYYLSGKINFVIEGSHVIDRKNGMEGFRKAFSKD